MTILQLQPLQDGVSSVMSCFATGQHKKTAELDGKVALSKPANCWIDGAYIESIDSI